MAFLQTIPLLAVNEESLALADALLKAKAVPEKAGEDALHIALATTNGMAYLLLTWNFKHIANAVMQTKIEQVCRNFGHTMPVICTPQALSED